jgi:hypothetical protein
LSYIVILVWWCCVQVVHDGKERIFELVEHGRDDACDEKRTVVEEVRQGRCKQFHRHQQNTVSDGWKTRRTRCLPKKTL